MRLLLRRIEETDAVATFGGGCYWCTEAVFRGVKGVSAVRSGFSDGEVANPDLQRGLHWGDRIRRSHSN